MARQIFVYTGENFAKKLNSSKISKYFNLLTGEIHIGVDRKGCAKKILGNCEYPFYSKAVYNMKLSFAYSDQPCICRINFEQAHYLTLVRTKFGFG